MTDATYHVPVVLVPVVPVLSLIVFLEMTLPFVLGAAFLGAAFLPVLFLAAGMLTAVRRGRWRSSHPRVRRRLYRRLLPWSAGARAEEAAQNARNRIRFEAKISFTEP